MCPADKSTDLTRSFRGVIMAVNAEKSEIAKVAGITAPGKYAIKIK
jgi:RNA polymerase subunit RPABC4/transcription elongation factor Spt4